MTHPRELGWPSTAALLALGFAAILGRSQRRRAEATCPCNPRCDHGVGPAAEIVLAEYTTANGEKHRNILLASGFWGVAGDFHYVPELTLALAWSLPAGTRNFLPYFDLTFLTILLVDRAGRDDLRCRTKYGSAWDEYCRRVPYTPALDRTKKRGALAPRGSLRDRSPRRLRRARSARVVPLTLIPRGRRCRRCGTTDGVEPPFDALPRLTGCRRSYCRFES